MAKQITTVTEAGFKKLKDELDYLKNVKRREAAERVGEARSYGDLSENSEYDDAKNEQAKVEAQIAELEEILADEIKMKGVLIEQLKEIKRKHGKLCVYAVIFIRIGFVILFKSRKLF